MSEQLKSLRIVDCDFGSIYKKTKGKTVQFIIPERVHVAHNGAQTIIARIAYIQNSKIKVSIQSFNLEYTVDVCDIENDEEWKCIEQEIEKRKKELISVRKEGT